MEPKVLLTPKPSTAIVKFWQGIVEVVLRSVCIVLTVLALIGAIAAVRDLGEPETPLPSIEALRFNTRSPSGWILLVTLIALPFEIVVLIVRFLNVPVVNKFSTIFLLIDAIVNFVITGFFFGGALALGLHATEWARWRASASEMEDLIHGLFRIVPSVRAESTFSFFASFGFFALGVWMLLFVIMRWNKSVDKYIVNPKTVEPKDNGSVEDVQPVTMSETKEQLEFTEDTGNHDQ